MNKTPKISVVIVTFNCANVLEVAIQSYISQDYDLKELLIIDGKSTDGTVDIIQKYKNNIDYWVSEKDKGIYDAMNKGWHRATGDYILYLGSDDKLLPHALSALANAANKADIVYGDVKCLHPNGVIKERIADDPSIIRERPFCSHQSLMMRKNVFERYNGFDCQYKLLADYDLILRACLGGARLQYTHQFISLFSMGGASAFTYRSDIEKLRIHRASKSISHPLLLFMKNVIFKTLLILRNKLLR